MVEPSKLDHVDVTPELEQHNINSLVSPCTNNIIRSVDEIHNDIFKKYNIFTQTFSNFRLKTTINKLKLYEIENDTRRVCSKIKSPHYSPPGNRDNVSKEFIEQQRYYDCNATLNVKNKMSVNIRNLNTHNAGISVSSDVNVRPKPNYLQKHNKRLKIGNSKQTEVTEFYSIAKLGTDKENDTGYFNVFQKPSVEYVSDIHKVVNIPENKDLCKIPTSQDFLSLRYTTASKLKEGNDWNLFRDRQKVDKSKLSHKLSTNNDKIIKVRTSTNHCNDRVNASSFNSKFVSKWSVDDFCNKLTSNIESRLEKEAKVKAKISNYKENLFSKSFSTGNLIEKIDNSKNDTNSFPITKHELRNVSNNQVDGRSSFEDFINKIISQKKDEKNIVPNISTSEKDCNFTKPDLSEGIGVEELFKKRITGKLEPKSCREISHNQNDSVNILRENFCYENKLNGSSQKLGHARKADVDEMYKLNSLVEVHNEVNCKHLTMEGKNIKPFYTCPGNKDTCFNQYKTDLELETKISSLENSLEKSILSSTYKRYMRNPNKENNSKINETLHSILHNAISNNANKTNQKVIPAKNRFCIKKYKKGKIKIYKLKKIEQKYIDIGKCKEDLKFDDIFKKTTTQNSKTMPRLSSDSSVATQSSYIADDTNSDILSTGSDELTLPEQRLRKGLNELSRDKSLRYPKETLEDILEADKEKVKMKIQDILFQIFEDFRNGKASCFKHRRQSFANCIFKDGRLQIKPAVESSITVISSNSERSRSKFYVMLYIMSKIHALLETDTKLTKRELFYQLKDLISDQPVSDRAINAISCLLNVGMWALNIIAQKGLVFGDLKLLLSSGEMLNCNIPGTLIPPDINDIVEIHSPAYFILVVEKESIFHKLIEEDLPKKLTRPFIMITGKGFPDLNTQLFLRKLWVIMSIPVFILVDADPHGINIMLNYRFGSVKNAHVSQHLAVPNAKWLGIYPSEITNFNITRQSLTENEIKLVNSILRTPYMEFAPKLVAELNIMLTTKYKAGIEGLMKTDSYLSDVYLPNKFFNRNFI